MFYHYLEQNFQNIHKKLDLNYSSVEEMKFQTPSNHSNAANTTVQLFSLMRKLNDNDTKLSHLVSIKCRCFKKNVSESPKWSCQKLTYIGYHHYLLVITTILVIIY